MLSERVKAFKQMLAVTFYKHCGSGLWMLKYHLLVHMIEDIRKLRTLSVLNGSPCEYCNMHVNHS